MITLSILQETLIATEGYPSGLCYCINREAVVCAQVDSRPDPIRRAWAAVQAKRGIAHG